MTTGLTPAVALAYLGSLWVDLRGAAVLDAAGACLAGDTVVAERAAVLLTTAAPGRAQRSQSPGGVLYAARSKAHGVAVLVGPEALEAVVVCDLLAVLDDLDGC